MVGVDTIRAARRASRGGIQAHHAFSTIVPGMRGGWSKEAPHRYRGASGLLCFRDHPARTPKDTPPKGAVFVVATRL
jgi:hypothetical protein